MSYTTRGFSHKEVKNGTKHSSPVRVGTDGKVSVTIVPNTGWEPRKNIGVALQVNLTTNHDSRYWANLRNVGDPFTKLYRAPNEAGLLQMHVIDGSAYGFTNIVPGAWVRLFIYRLDNIHRSVEVSIRTSYGETFLDTPVKVTNDIIETENENQWVSKTGDNA